MQINPIKSANLSKNNAFKKINPNNTTCPITFGIDNDYFQYSEQKELNTKEEIKASVDKHLFSTRIQGNIGEQPFCFIERSEKISGNIGKDSINISLIKRRNSDLIDKYRGQIGDNSVILNTLFLDNKNKIYGYLGNKKLELYKEKISNGYSYRGNLENKDLNFECETTGLYSRIKGTCADEEIDFTVSNKGLYGKYKIDSDLLPVILPQIYEDINAESI